MKPVLLLLLLTMSAIAIYALFAIPKFLLINIQRIANGFSPEIKTETELEKILMEEQEKLGLLSKNIEILWQQPGTRCKKVDTNRYLIYSGLNPTRLCIAHELYHISDGSIDRDFAEHKRFLEVEPYKLTEIEALRWLLKFRLLKPLSRRIKYLYWREPRATFYELKRLWALNQQPN